MKIMIIRTQKDLNKCLYKGRRNVVNMFILTKMKLQIKCHYNIPKGIFFDKAEFYKDILKFKVMINWRTVTK